MRAAKQTTAIAVLIVLTIGLSYAQVCDFTCAVGKCPASSTVAASPEAREAGQSGRCHEAQFGPDSGPNSGHESGKAPRDNSSSPGREGSRACPGHIDASTLRPGGTGIAFPSHERPDIQALIARGFQALTGSNADSGISKKETPLRSPPTRSVLRI